MIFIVILCALVFLGIITFLIVHKNNLKVPKRFNNKYLDTPNNILSILVIDNDGNISTVEVPDFLSKFVKYNDDIYIHSAITWSDSISSGNLVSVHSISEYGGYPYNVDNELFIRNNWKTKRYF